MAEKSKPKAKKGPGPVAEEVVDAEIIADLPPEPIVEEAKRESSGTSWSIAIAAAALLVGGGAVYWLLDRAPNNQAEIDRLSAQIAALTDTVSTPDNEDQTAQAVDRLEGALNDQLGGLGSSIGGLTERLEQVDARMAALEDQTSPNETLEGVTDGLQTLRDDLGTWRAEAARLKTENTRLEEELAKQAEALDQVKIALDAANGKLDEAESVRAVTNEERLSGILAQIEIAVADGSAFVGPAQEYQNVTGNSLPEALVSRSEKGVSTVEALQVAFPDLARRALAASLSAQVNSNPIGKATDFLKVQLGMRSVVPREGNDPDAVLSRAQDAVSQGNLDAALLELEGLPDVGRAELSDWTKSAKQTTQAFVALSEVTQ